MVASMAHFAGNTGKGRQVDAGHTPAVVALCGVQFVDVLGVTVVVAALPSMLADLQGSAADGTVVVTAYALAFGGLLMAGSRLGDRMGPRRVLLRSLVLFAATSTLGAVADAVWTLALARVGQGAAAAAAVPAALRLLTTVVPEGRPRRRAVAAWSAAGAAAGAAGFVIGGVVTEAASWRLIFWLNLGLAALLVAAVARVVERDDPPVSTTVTPWSSAVMLIGVAVAVVGGATLMGDGGSATTGVIAVTAGGVLAMAFAHVERRADEPLVPLAARRSAALRWGTWGSFVNTATTSSSMTVATLHLQDQLGLGPLRTAAILVTFSVLVVPGSVAAPAVVGALGWGRTLAGGLAIVAAGNAVLVVAPQPFGVAAAAGICGLGIGLGSVAATGLGTAVEDGLKGVAAGVLNTAAQLGTAVGTAMVLLVARATEDRAAWAVAALAAGSGAILAAVRAPGRPARTTQDQASGSSAKPQSTLPSHCGGRPCVPD